MSDSELNKKYQPSDIESRWEKEWLEAKIYGPESNSELGSKSNKPSYTIVIPPPNVTGVLHMGHALNDTLQDILIRYHRMQGDSALWVFGMDHAGIATQNVVEKQLKAQGQSRFDLGREAFIDRVWQWREESGGHIREQLKKLGASLDYENERFTMDEGLSEAVRKVFVQLYKEGLIYRGERLINWCPRCHTALSDLEVEHEDQKGTLWHIRYPLSSTISSSSMGLDHIIVATTRPETLLGDTAVAVHPEDERYKDLVGQTVDLPFTDRKIKIIADDYVDPEFGSGFVKITPAHDFNDFEVGERHSLERINVLTDDAKMNENAFAYQGLDRLACREKIVADLKAQDLLEKIEENPMSVGHCYRCKTVVEPYLSKQWFVDAKTLAKPALEAVKNGQTKIIPQQWENTYFNWMENIRDWCVSRQIWWGHRIPAWYCEQCSETKGDDAIIVSEELPSHCPQCQSTELRQETDVLDTWFSSALWPFSTLGWPNTDSDLLKKYYPTATLVTGFDIIFFWVARMMMMGLHFMKEVPFKEVYIHALVRDAQGQKMSKSKGNVLDPLVLMEKYGTDAFRFTLAAFAAQGRDIKLAEDRIEGYRNFANKIWNAARFVFSVAGEHAQLQTDKKIEDYIAVVQNLDEQSWILIELSQTIAKVKLAIKNYRFNEAALSLYHFFWHSFCDWYLEFIKKPLYKGEDSEKQQVAEVALFVLDQSLRLLHPFMPFLTEELWQKLADRQKFYLTQSAYPTVLSDAEAQGLDLSWQRIEQLKVFISKIRQMRTETQIAPSKKIRLLVLGADKLEIELESFATKLSDLAGVDSLEKIDQEPDYAVAKGVLSIEGVSIYIPLEDLIDLEKEKQRQEKEIARVQKGIDAIERMINKPGFADKAPAELVSKKKTEHQELLERKTQIEAALSLLLL